MIVLKFGGTSVGSAGRVRDAARIALSQASPRVVVVSAASGLTNALLEAARAAVRGDLVARDAALSLIHGRHDQILNGIESELQRKLARNVLNEVHNGLDATLDEVASIGELSDAASDRIVATGEKCLATLMAATMRDMGHEAEAVFTDSIIATDGRHGAARPDRAVTRENAEHLIQPLLDAGITVVATGFIGSGPDGATTTLGRGGSDYSATLLGAALDADEVQIWTDVPGVLSADPRAVARAQVVPEISYDEAQELAHFGAKVLHPRTIRPAVALDIPVRILSTFLPGEPGTVVMREAPSERIKAVTALKGLILMTLDVPELEDLAPAASAVFRVMHEKCVEILNVSQASSRRRMTYILDAVTGGCANLQLLLETELDELDARIACHEHVAVLAAVGSGAAGTASSLTRMLTVLNREKIAVLAMNQQTSSVAMISVVNEVDADRAVAALHNAFIRPVVSRSHSRRRRRTDLLSESLRVG
ncbi:MAG: aspartate kinase [Chloroflexia bacterium]|nr:aspartate kinase [Chloroflexia bacterium]